MYYLCDIYLTLLGIVGVSPQTQPPLDGVSLLPLIDGVPPTDELT